MFQAILLIQQTRSPINITYLKIAVMNLDMAFKMIHFNAGLSDDFKVNEISYFTIFSKEKKETKQLDKKKHPTRTS